ncbi:hypothetical protein ABOM_001608 [Aspergillus bombycis]|uniref:Uncharacterized protein n=1 Tax=Aspergillus bombycis TaxID=109264 RepID=A0A1F8ADP9_9EURO|nr:hypothetical protein ABOM_001608 [Aspergillus bombycis]OGM49853.1 hypothetical protein ABOM_001608 [Aspergillus bombycis]
MKLSNVLINSLLPIFGLSHPFHLHQEKHLVRLPLPPPDNWVAGPRLFPGEVIAGFHAHIDEHDAKGWREYVNQQCEKFHDCTSTLSFSANNVGSTGGRYWFGYVFRGGPTTPDDYVRDWTARAQVKDSAAYTVSFEDGDDDGDDFLWLQRDIL